jgi:hypothetical protein
MLPERYHAQHGQGYPHSMGSHPRGAGQDEDARCNDGTGVSGEIGLNPRITRDGIVLLSSIGDLSARRMAAEGFLP